MRTNDWIGKTLSGRYQIEELIGQGGMSSVFKANDPNLKRVVAIKIIHEHLSSDPGFVSRFEEEAAAVAHLRHPNIVQVHDFNNEDGVYYMVMEFIPGETLQRHLKRLNQADRSMPLEDVVEYMASICEASDYAHDRGLIHRDIKPANIMLSVHKQAILMDFGIARIVGGQQHTATGAVVGTAQYMSPEQIKGEQLDRRSDIYSLGVSLFEMVSGHPPFEADSAMTLMMMHINDPIPDIREINPDVPLELVAVINKALEKSKENRYQTAGEMAAALNAVTGQPAIIPPPPPALDATLVEEAQPFVEVAAATAVEMSDATLIEPDLASQETAAESSLPPPPPTDTGKPAGEQVSRKIKPLYLFGAGAIILLALIGIIFGGPYLSNLFSGGNDEGLPIAVVSTTQEPNQIALVDTQTPTSTPTDTATPIPPTATFTPTTTPTITPTPTSTPTPTVPPGVLFARINNITINDQNRYVVEYETFKFIEMIPCTYNVHFYFDTVSQENAGVPGSGPWFAYGGPRPFTGYTVFDRPAEAKRMCILVANSNNTIHLNSGYCVDLPTPQQTTSLSFLIGLIRQSIFSRLVTSTSSPQPDPDIPNANFRIGGCG
jgi:serine/threonine protein kinase